MWTDPTKFTGTFKYREVGRYVADLNQLIRHQKGPKGDRIPVLLDDQEVQEYAAKNDNTGIYTSLWYFNDRDLSRSSRLGSLYFDLDSSEIRESLTDTRTLVDYLRKYIPEDAIRVYFTGLKGFHVECEAVALGIGPGNNVHSVFRYIANSLKGSLGINTFDFQVYDIRRMWRLPNSRHQSTGLYKVELGDRLYDTLDEIQAYAREPNTTPVPDQRFSASANEWYREWTYKIEEDKKTTTYTTQDLIERFNKHGTKMVRTDGEKEFDPKELFDNCHAILDWWKYAEEKKDLPHEARLFLCSILTYNDEAIFYLHEILKNCSDYSWEKSNAHIADWIRRRELGIGGRPYSCERANNAGVGCGDCQLETRNKWVEVNGKLIETDEQASPSPIRFGYSIKKKA